MNKIFFYLFTSSILVKLWLAAFIPLAPDEAYYRLWSQYLQLSYFDHPPMIAWMIFISEKIGVVLPSPELTVRIFGVLIHHATAFIIVKLYQKIIQRSQFGKQEICIFLLFLFHPLLGFFQILQTPDLPLLFFWSLSNLIFFELLTSKKRTLFFLLGFVLGLGFLSKYMIVLWGFSLIVLFLLHYRQRSLWFLISSRNVVIGFLALFLASAPVWIWNVMNGWASFKFQISHGFEAPGFEYHWVYNYLAGVAILSGAYLFSVDFSKVPTFNETQRIQTHFIIIQLFLPLLFFLNSSFHAPTEVNWPIMGYMSLPILIVLLGRSQKWITVAVVGSGVVTMIMAAAVLGPWVKIPQIEQMKNLKALGKRLSSDTHPLYTCKYQTAALLDFYSSYPVFKLQDCSRYDFYDSRAEFVNKNDVFFIYKTENQDIPSMYQPVELTLLNTEAEGHALYRVERRQ